MKFGFWWVREVHSVAQNLTKSPHVSVLEGIRAGPGNGPVTASRLEIPAFTRASDAARVRACSELTSWFLRGSFAIAIIAIALGAPTPDRWVQLLQDARRTLFAGIAY